MIPHAAADATSVIEVADSSLEYDREQKLALYARVGISQYLIVNLRDGLVEVHEDPIPKEESFARRRVCRSGDRVVLQVTDGALEIEAARILP